MGRSKRNIDRRTFLQITSGSVAAMLLPEIAVDAAEKPGSDRPNFLWISCEDICPDLGCYGDRYAVTPNIDRLASQGERYTNVFSHSGVCAPSRSGIITGMYPTTIGTHQMRCQGVPPAQVRCFSEYLRAASYYCTNNVKTDYQFDPPPTAWDECSNKAHWRNRPKGQPFFAVFNLTISHESQIRNRSPEMLKRLDSLSAQERHDPAKAVLPPYYPDTPVVRKDWAQYYDVVTLMDKQVSDILKQLDEDGLADNTVVWFWGDNGRGLPRAKRWVYDSGIHIPLIIRVPEKWRKLGAPNNPDALKPGTTNDDLISFIDFAPTMLSLAGMNIPDHIRGRAFLGPRKAEPREYIFAARDRMDETYDIIRAVRDKRYKYIRNYMPHLSRGQNIDYMDEMPAMQEMRRLNAEGRLTGTQRQYFEPTKPIEELYDTVSDPHEVSNLADNPAYKAVLERMRTVHQKWMKQIGDVGLIPEPEFDEMKRPGGEWEKTAEPVFTQLQGDPQSAGLVTIACATAGSSIACRIGDGAESKTHWQLYTKPVQLKQGQVLHAKACRIGFKDSSEVKFRLGDRLSAPPQAAAAGHWKDKLDKTDLLDRLYKIKDLDYQGPKANYLFLKALKDKYASVRYWAVIGLHGNCTLPADRTWAQVVLKEMLGDPAPVVRVAAAHALCDWGQEEQALPVLIEGLKGKSDKVRLHAATALKMLGEKGRPALQQMKATLKDSDDYVQRVGRATLKLLEQQ